MVRGAVAFDAGEIAARLVGMDDAEVDSETRDAHLGDDLPPADWQNSA